MDPKFKDLKKDKSLNDVDWTNAFYDFKKIFEGVKNCEILSDTEVACMDPNNISPEDMKNPTFILQDGPGGMVRVVKDNKWRLPVGVFVSKFTLLCKIAFDGDIQSAMSFISIFERKNPIPYMRVGVNYFKVINKDNRYGANCVILKAWSKDEIKQDHGVDTLKLVPKWDDFTIVPDNIQYRPSYKNCYNLYSEFPHKPFADDVTEKDIPQTMILLNHIFGDQIELGIKYMKILYEDPKQILPVLSLVSAERETGKTTFLNWIQMVFGENSVIISPQELTFQFNSGYATKNIVMIDETVIEKSTSVEKLKSLATAKTISVSEKFIAHYSVPFFGKIIICTNKEKDFMKVDEEEIRFWIRKVSPIPPENKNTNIEIDLFSEIPKFLKYLTQQPVVDKTKSRMVFTMDEISTNALAEVKNESRSWLRKELEIEIESYFHIHDYNEFEATVKDIKNEWFKHNNNVTMSYLRKVLKQEMKLSSELKKYNPFNRNDEFTKLTGRPFKFINPRLSEELAETPANEDDLPF